MELTDRASATRPVVSVIVPVRNDADQLRRCLRSLAGATFDGYEVIVVDDASTDSTSGVANELGVRLIQLASQSGPAAARNAGVLAARGEYVLFIDADVCAPQETITQFVDVFRSDAGIDAVFGSYDRNPGAPNVLSQYKNLFHHFVHQQAHRDACTFWAGCGAVKRSVFLQAGGFDERYRRPCVEDIELGMRLVGAGHRVVLEKSIQVRHLKHWNLWSIVRTDVIDRAIPWTELIMRDRSVPNDLNLKTSQRVCALLSCGLFGSLLAGAWHWPGLLMLVAMAFLLMQIYDRRSLRGKVPVLMQAAAIGAVCGATGLVGVMFEVWSLIPAISLLAVISINFRLYAFFARERSLRFAAASIPLHILYYNYSSLSFGFVVGVSLWNWVKRVGLGSARTLNWLCRLAPLSGASDLSDRDSVVETEHRLIGKL